MLRALKPKLRLKPNLRMRAVPGMPRVFWGLRSGMLRRLRVVLAAVAAVAAVSLVMPLAYAEPATQTTTTVPPLGGGKAKTPKPDGKGQDESAQEGGF